MIALGENHMRKAGGGNGELVCTWEGSLSYKKSRVESPDDEFSAISHPPASTMSGVTVSQQWIGYTKY